MMHFLNLPKTGIEIPITSGGYRYYSAMRFLVDEKSFSRYAGSTVRLITSTSGVTNPGMGVGLEGVSITEESFVVGKSIYNVDNTFNVSLDIISPIE